MSVSGTKIAARCAARIDLAGGTLDLWPLYLLHPGSITVNFAFALDAEARVSPLPGSRVELVSHDLGSESSAEHPNELDPRDTLSLLVHLVRHLRPDGGVRVETKSASPPGAGLGASSALAAAVVSALDRFSGTERDMDDVVRVARDCETQALGFPAGSQDYWPGLRGGALALHWDIAGCRVETLPLDREEVSQRFAIAYTGAPHHSGLSNWAIYKARLEGNTAVHDHLEGVREAALALRERLLAQDWDGVAEALEAEWSHRRQLGENVSTEQIDALLADSKKAGATAGKVCGAGGGGCVLLLCRPGMKPDVEAVFARHGATSIPVRLADGVRIETVS